MFLSSIVLLSLSSAAQARCDLSHYITYKSFYTAMYECGQYFEICNNTLDQYIYNGYPSTPEVMRLIHCACVNTGAWNDNTGVRKNVFQFLFKPNEHDTEYEDRTQCCLDKICKDGYDQNYLAYETFSCYYQQYGRLVKNEVFVPLEELEFFQLMTFIAKILLVSKEKLIQFSQGDFLNDPVFKQALYITAIRQGSYSLEKGFIMEVGYAQYNIPELFAPCTRQCVIDASAEYSQLPVDDLVYKVYKKCLHSLVDPILVGYFKAILREKACGMLTSY
ncbi:general odorant-binding protein 69-like [Ochlerotatus camptorhynchus]|uniref:general odorant-binding protein 69-like n=1 Tax=Ochlerotatus camptorhynchus TaxID=644619 RepID=UPI0031E0B0D7